MDYLFDRQTFVKQTVFLISKIFIKKLASKTPKP